MRLKVLVLFGLLPMGAVCQNSAAVWLTTPDKQTLFKKQDPIAFGASAPDSYPSIQVDGKKTYQRMDGFGFALTGGSAALIDGLPKAERASILEELFSTKGIGISYLRISIGASDLDPAVFSYDDMPKGQKDPGLDRFSISRDREHLIPLLHDILAINPHIKILGSPWSAPAWMKDNDTSEGGHLLAAYYKTYARYLVKYVRAMKAAGIRIDAITPQNEPMNERNNPSMVVTDTAEAAFIRTALGPVFREAGLATKIIVWDHNCDWLGYPLYILGDPKAAAYVDGSGWHLYRGEISALSKAHDAFPDKNIYFTEEYTAGGSNFGGDLSWHVENLIIGAPRNWAKNVLEWNLASDPRLEPHTPGGCNTCLGALTVGGDSVTRNVSYYIIAHASKFVRPGSVRIASTESGAFPNVAFHTPDGKTVLIVLNHGQATQSFHIVAGERQALATLTPGAVATYVW